MRNSTRLRIWRDLSLPRDSRQPFINWGTTQGRLSLPTADVLSTIVKQSMLMDVDKLSSCSWFSDSVVGFTRQKIQPSASKYWRKYCKVTCFCRLRHIFSSSSSLREGVPSSWESAVDVGVGGQNWKTPGRHWLVSDSFGDAVQCSGPLPWQCRSNVPLTQSPHELLNY